MEERKAYVAPVESIRRGILFFIIATIVVTFAGWFPFWGMMGFMHWHTVDIGPRPLGLVGGLTMALLLVLAGAFFIVGVLSYRRGFDELARLSRAKYEIGATGALILLVGSILIITVVLSPIGLILAWLGIVLSGIAVLRLGEEFNSTFTVISAVLFMVPFINWLGAIFLYFALGEILSEIRGSA